MFREQIKQAISEKKYLQICGQQSKVKFNPEFEYCNVSEYQGIIDYQPAELVITVKAGTPLSEINAVLAENNQYLPFEPPDYGNSSIGGSYACGLSGSSQPFQGGLRDYVLGIVIYNGKGERLTFGGQMMKNVAGFDVSRLLVGSKGEFALIAEISFKVLPFAPQQTYALDLPEAEAIQLMNQWAGTNRPLSACGYFNDTFYYRLSGSHQAQTALPVDNQIWQTLNPFRCSLAPNETLWRLSVDSTEAPIENTIAIDWRGVRRWVKAVEAPPFRFISAWQGVQAQTPPLNDLAKKLKPVFDPYSIFKVN